MEDPDIRPYINLYYHPDSANLLSHLDAETRLKIRDAVYARTKRNNKIATVVALSIFVGFPILYGIHFLLNG